MMKALKKFTKIMRSFTRNKQSSMKKFSRVSIIDLESLLSILWQNRRRIRRGPKMLRI